MSIWYKPYGEDMIRPLKMIPRVGKNRGPHPLKKGWRWLAVGEWVEVGDLCCDPRIMPIRIQLSHAWKMTPTHHPVMRKITGRISHSD